LIPCIEPSVEEANGYQDLVIFGPNSGGRGGMKIHFTGFIRSFIIVGALKSRTSSHGHVQVQHV